MSAPGSNEDNDVWTEIIEGRIGGENSLAGFDGWNNHWIKKVNDYTYRTLSCEENNLNMILARISLEVFICHEKC